MNSYDFVVVFRIYPGISKSPAYFSDNKLNMLKMMLDSFKKSIGDLSSFVYVLLDNCPESYEKLFHKMFLDEDMEILQLEQTGNYGTFNKQIELLLEQDKSEIVFFAEDDYLYRPGQLKNCILKMKEDKRVDFITPYDHADYYTLPLHERPVRVSFSHNTHWREAVSTCLTFITRKSVLSEASEVFHFFSHGLHDAALWMVLTRFNMFNISNFFNLWRKKKSYARWIIKAWKFGWKYLLFGRKYTLISPIPAAGTHLEGSLLSPGIDWDEYKKD